ncbi:MAG: TetR/AcrR family transcriptional regulator [Burkholderia sp.]
MEFNSPASIEIIVHERSFRPTRKRLAPFSDGRRDRPCPAAETLFYREGVRAVIEQTGVNKMSLYRQFASKDELALAYLECKNEHYFDCFDEDARQLPDNPKAQLLKSVDELAVRAAALDYRGCPFINVAVEFPDPNHAARASVADNKAELMRRLLALAQGTGASQTYRGEDSPIGTAPPVGCG